jgi:hypothetical protein
MKGKSVSVKRGNNLREKSAGPFLRHHGRQRLAYRLCEAAGLDAMDDPAVQHDFELSLAASESVPDRAVAAADRGAYRKCLHASDLDSRF